MPGQPDGAITVHLGYGLPVRGSYSGTYNGTAGDVVGFDAYAIRTSFEPWSMTGVRVTNPGIDYQLATTQLHLDLEDPRFSTESATSCVPKRSKSFCGGEKT